MQLQGFFSSFLKRQSATMYHWCRYLLLCLLLLEISLGSSIVYLWTKKIRNTQLLPKYLPQKRTDQINQTGNNIGFTRPLLELPLVPADAPSGKSHPSVTNAATNDDSVKIQLFPEFKLDANNAEGDLNLTLDWADLWLGDSNCTRFQIHLLKPGTQPQPGAFVSFPGSGNSWIKTLVMRITGIYITTVYKDIFRSKANSIYRIPPDCGCSLLKKTHDFSLNGVLYNLHKGNRTDTLNQFQSKGILIIRDPFKAIQSYRNFQHGGMMALAPRSAFRGKKWDTFVSQSIASWETLATTWIRGLKQGGIIYYERLYHETRSELKRLMRMIGLNYDQDRFECGLRHARDDFFKRKQPKKMNPYTDTQKLLIHKAIESVQLALKERELDPLPVQHYDLYVDNIPEYGLPD